MGNRGEGEEAIATANIIQINDGQDNDNYNYKDSKISEATEGEKFHHEIDNAHDQDQDDIDFELMYAPASRLLLELLVLMQANPSTFDTEIKNVIFLPIIVIPYQCGWVF